VQIIAVLGSPAKLLGQKHWPRITFVPVPV
jgi:hypothetical protein